MKKSVLLLIGIFLVNISFAQLALKIEQAGVKQGFITKNGTKIDGYIKIKEYVYINQIPYSAPWSFQKSIKFIEKNKFETLDVINAKSYKEYTAKDIESYTYDNQEYTSVKYGDQSAISFDMIKRQIFLRKMLDGKAIVYQYYTTPSEIIPNDIDLPSLYNKCAKPQWVFQHGNNEKIKLVRDINVKKEFKDCPTIVQRYKNGEYNVVGYKQKM